MFRRNCHDSDWIRHKLCAGECKTNRLRTGIDHLRILSTKNKIEEIKVLFVPNAEESIKQQTKNGVHRTTAMSGWIANQPEESFATGVEIFILERTLSGWAIAFVRPVGAIPRSVAPPSFGQASVLVLAAEFLFTASGAGEFVVSQAAILSAVTDPTFGNARVVAVATVLVGQAFTFGSCTHPVMVDFRLCGGFRQKVGSFSEENQSKKK